MSDSGPRSGRLLSIVLLLQTRGGATAAEIAAQVGVSVRTVYRDVDVLSRIGVPIYAETGRAGGYRLVDGYRTSLTGLTGQEALALFLIGLPAPAASLGLTDEARVAGDKLLAALSPAHREQATLLRDRFLLDLPAWYRSSESPAALPELADAVLANRRVRVRYRRWEEPREVCRLLDPHGLVVKHGTWYLVAAAGPRGALRAYRVGHVLDVERTGETFERRPGFELESFWRTHLDDFDRRRLVGSARLRLSPELVAALPDVGDAAIRAAADAGTVDTDGWTVVDLPYESPAWAAAKIVRHAADLEVVAPDELRIELCRIAAAVLARHERTEP